MTQHGSRLVGGIYRVGQVITQGQLYTASTAYNRNTNDMVGLLMIEVPPTVNMQHVSALLQPLEHRRQIVSPHVLRVYDWGLEARRAYIATDALRGVPLRHVLNLERVDLQRAFGLIRQIAQGVVALHAQGIVGLDLRPQLITVNMVDGTDSVQLDDVGLRPLLNGLGYRAAPSSADIAYFDPRYMSPEALQGGVIGPWSDVYQVGLVLFELVAGRLPFVGRTPEETGVLQTTRAIPRVADYAQNVPDVAQELIAQMLAKNPVQRFTSAAAMLKAIERLPPSISSQNPDSTREMSRVEHDVTLRATLLERAGSGPATPTLPTGEGVYAYLCSKQEGVDEQQFAITEKDVVVGRADPKRNDFPDIDLSGVDPRVVVSRKHARIRYEESTFYIEDLKSHNGTRLGELRLLPLKPEVLRHGDIMRLGSVLLVFKVPGMS